MKDMFATCTVLFIKGYFKLRAEIAFGTLNSQAISHMNMTFKMFALKLFSKKCPYW